jgi:hypothetical protein
VEEIYLTQADNYFHNNLHVADVTQSLHAMLYAGGVGDFYDPMDILGSCFAAAVHDLGHDGRNNMFHVAIQDEKALTYNDKSVMQNYAISRAFRLLKEKPETNFIAKLIPAQARTLRREVVSMVLSTDVSAHHRLRSSFDNGFIKYGQQPEKWHDDEQAMDSVRGMMLHFADNSMLAKKSSMALDWYERYQNELFAQGDAEKAHGLPISPLCQLGDRREGGLSGQASQKKQARAAIGLLDFVVWPLLVSLSKLSTKMDDEVSKHVRWNREMWERKDRELESRDDT